MSLQTLARISSPLRNPGFVLAVALLAVVIQSSCKSPEAPHGPDSSRVGDTLHKDSTHTTDTNTHNDTTLHHDTTHVPFDGLLTPRDSDTMNGGIALSGDGNVLACSGFRQSDKAQFVYIFDVNTGKVLNRIVTAEGPQNVKLDGKGRTLLVQGISNMYLYNTTDGYLIHEFPGSGGWLTTTGDSLLTNTATGALGFVDQSGNTIREFTTPMFSIPEALSRDGKTILMFTGDRKIYLMDAATGARITSYDRTADVYGTKESPDNVIMGGYLRDQSNGFMLYNTLTGEQFSSPTDQALSDFAFSNDHRSMAISIDEPNGTTTNAAIIDLHTGARLQELPGVFSPAPWVRKFCYSDDCKRLAGSFWNAVKVWKIK